MLHCLLSQPLAVTNGDLWADNGSTTSGEFTSASPSGLRYVQIDLGGVYNVDKVVVWHYALDGRTYHNTKTQVSADGTNWTTVYDSAVSGEYPETAAIPSPLHFLLCRPNSMLHS